MKIVVDIETKHSGAILRKALMMFKPDMTPNEISYDSVRSYNPPVRHDTRVEYKCTTIQFTKFAKVILSVHPHFFTFSKLQKKGIISFLGLYLCFVFDELPILHIVIAHKNDMSSRAF